MESDFGEVARAARAIFGYVAAWTTVLRIDETKVTVLQGSSETLESVQVIEIGPTTIANDFFHHDPPTSVEIELAIDQVEEQISKLGRPNGDRQTLWCEAHSLRGWKHAVASKKSIDEIEHWFQCIASASLGRPGAMQGLPHGRDAAATLLLLREFMHHQGFSSLFAVDLPRDPGC